MNVNKKNVMFLQSRRLIILSVISFFLVTLLLVNSNVAARADDYPRTGSCGDNLTWFVTGEGNNLTLTISGTGKMYDYDNYAPWWVSPYASKPEHVPSWLYYFQDFKTIVISNGVTSIGNYAFTCCSAENVNIAKSVTTIGNGAFYASNLKSVNIPNKVTKISYDAFGQCKLKSVTIGKGVKKIGTRAFAGNDKLKIIKINSKKISSFGKGSFMWINKKVTIKLPKSKKELYIKKITKAGAPENAKYK